MWLEDWHPLEKVQAALSPSAAVRRGAALIAAGKPEKAFQLYARASRSGHAEAEYRIGRCYIEGAGVPPSRSEGIRWLEQAANRGHIEAQSLLAAVCLHGGVRRSAPAAVSLFGVTETTDPDYGTAMRWARMAAENGSGEAQAVLAFIFASGPESMRNVDEADFWYERSAAAGCPQGLLGHALALARKGGGEEVQREVVANLRKSAEAELPAALYLLGVVSEHGLGTAHDQAAAAQFYRRAAQKGHRASQLRWGLALMHGDGVETNCSEGETWLRRAASAGDPEAAALIGGLYAAGGNLPPNHVEAASWFHRAAEAGHKGAARSLGLLYITGAGVPRDPEEAARWLRVSATGDDTPTSAELDNLFLNGIGEENLAGGSAAAGDADLTEGQMEYQDSLCACGSGLRSCRCCDLNVSYMAPPEANERVNALVCRARQTFAGGDTHAAERLCLNVLDVAPRVPDALWMLYQIRQRADQQEAAMALLRRLVAVDPNNVDATQELAMLLFQRGDLTAAEQHARNAVRLAPVHPRSHNLMGMILTEARRLQPGEFHYRRVIELAGVRDPILLANLAWNLKGQGRLAEARQLYEESVAAAPNVFQTWFGWAQLEEADRDFDAARSRLDQAARIRPDDPGLRLARAVLKSREGDPLAALAELPDPPHSPHGACKANSLDPNALLEKGRILDRLQRYDEAFACFDEAKRRAREGTEKGYFDREAREVAERLRQFFVSDRIRLLPVTPTREGCAQPIFVLGFPRSGTTLAEQALSNHPKISAADELPFINEFCDTIPRLLGSPLSYPEALSELWIADNRRGLETLRDLYLQKVETRGVVKTGSAWFTDKMPLNEMHLGLVSIVFPRSPLIHILRHPLDVILSVFSHHLTHGYFCAYALETIARHYVLIMDLVEHYRTEMALRYLPVRYESMVKDMSDSVRRMLEFIGEPFDARCVDFQDNRRLPYTPSYAQVTEKIYDRSLFRYRHYLKHLEPIIPIVQPVMSRLGYSLE